MCVIKSALEKGFYLRILRYLWNLCSFLGEKHSN